MKWFEGSITEAVTTSKAKNAIFVVFVEGCDEMSRTMSSVLDSSGISLELASSMFVCIKLTKDSESHSQFIEIYKIVPVPSLFFIGENGVPLEIVAGDMSGGNVLRKVASAISKIKGEPISIDVSERAVNREESTSSVEPVSKSPSSERLDSKVVPSAPPESSSSSSADNVVVAEVLKETSSTNDNTKEQERVEELIKEKREEIKKVEEEKEKERELARRKMGKDINQARKSQQERELEDMRREREKDKKMETEARQRVLKQIEEDKANRAAKMAASSSSPPRTTSAEDSSAKAQPSRPLCPGNESRIQFKLPDGQTRTQNFLANLTLRDLRSFIDSNIEIPFKEYMLATTFPRREFTSRDLDRDLRQLELFPSSVLLILPVQGNLPVMRGPGWTSAMSAMLWNLVQQVMDFGSYLRALFTGARRDERSSPSPPPTAASSSTAEQPQQEQQPTRPPYYANLGGSRSVRKRGNVHSLSDGNDSNDENNTWNGNSTQLM